MISLYEGKKKGKKRVWEWLEERKFSHYRVLKLSPISRFATDFWVPVYFVRFLSTKGKRKGKRMG
jgi:hypothetical protein